MQSLCAFELQIIQNLLHGENIDMAVKGHYCEPVRNNVFTHIIEDFGDTIRDITGDEDSSSD
jgi:hypothetical protein